MAALRAPARCLPGLIYNCNRTRRIPMKHSRWLSPVPLAVLIGIGCGGGKPPEASAKTEQAPVAAAQVAQAPSGGNPTGSGVISGEVKFSGTPPKAQPVQMAADPVCQQAHPEPIYPEEVAVGPGGGLKNVLVYVKEGLQGSFPPAAQPAMLNQSGCWYMPH